MQVTEDCWQCAGSAVCMGAKPLGMFSFSRCEQACAVTNRVGLGLYLSCHSGRNHSLFYSTSRALGVFHVILFIHSFICSVLLLSHMTGLSCLCRSRNLQQNSAVASPRLWDVPLPRGEVAVPSGWPCCCDTSANKCV